MKRLSLVVVLFILAFPLYSLTLKLGSILPAGSSWDRVLKEMAEEWREISGGRVNIRIYPGSIAGSEEDMVRKMKIGQLDMGVFTSAGLTIISPDSFILSMPFLIKDERELDFALSSIAPDFNNQFEEQGFKMLSWSKSGWVHIFSKKPVFTPDDLREQKLAVGDSDHGLVNVWKALNFRIVTLNTGDLMTGLQSGMTEAFYSPPMGAAAFQWFALAPHMSSVRLAPMVGGFVISERAWKRIPAAYRDELKASAERTSRHFYDEFEKVNVQAMEVMQNNGLKINEASSSDMTLWHNLADEGFDRIIGPGKVISQETYESATTSLEQFRSQRD